MLQEILAVADRDGSAAYGSKSSGPQWSLAKCRIRRGHYDDAEALLQPLLPPDGLESDREVFDLLAQCDIGRGRVESALARIAGSIAHTVPSENVERIFAEAEIAALRGQDEDALRTLARASELGFDDFDRLENDLAFVRLRSRTEFKAAVSAARRRAL